MHKKIATGISRPNYGARNCWYLRFARRTEFLTLFLGACLPARLVFQSATNNRYIYVLEAAGEAITQVIQNVHIPNEAPLAEDEDVDKWIECQWCGKSHKVS